MSPPGPRIKLNFNAGRGLADNGSVRPSALSSTTHHGAGPPRPQQRVMSVTDIAPQADQNMDDVMEEDADLDANIDPAPAQSQAAGETQENEEALLEAREPTKKDVSLRDFLAKMDDYAPIIPDAVTAHHLLTAGIDPATTPLPLSRLLALATQKFIADVAADAYQYSRMRSSNSAAANTAAGPGPGGLGATADQGTGGGRGKDDKGKSGAHVLGVQRPGYGGGGSGASAGQGGRAVLTMEDLGCAVGEYGVNVKRGEFYR